MQNIMRRILTSILGMMWGLILATGVYAQADDFFILPKDDGGADSAVERLTNEGGNVWDQYDKEAYTNPALVWEENIGNQLSSGILTRDSIIYYLVVLLQFLSQLGILIWVLMIIFVGYQYASYSITGQDPKTSYITHAIAWILVISFSYAILNILRNAFL